MAGLTYRDAGVDIDAGDALVDRIKPLAARTRIPEVVSGVGGFAGLCALPTDVQNPVLVSGTDGVGTKLKLAFLMDRHDTVGIDLVAMCVNDVLTVGARPLFFLDYFATGKLDVDRAEAVVRGIAKGCELSGCALLGGETAELPGFYAPGEYDLAGFAVGVVDRTKMLDGKAAKPGDVLLGVASSGLHSNGYSLARKALIEGPDALALDRAAPGLDEPLGDALIRPTKIYAKATAALLAAGPVHGLCHITGGGLPGNLPRVFPSGVGAEIDLASFERPAIFRLIQEKAKVEEHEMRRTFNLGLGFVAIVPAEAASAARAALEGAGETVFEIGRMVEMPGVDDEDEARVRFL
ncbi:MAG: phosphoribosylformylglycinamidine cyclo-ligase [Polyangiales bacterium]